MKHPKILKRVRSANTIQTLYRNYNGTYTLLIEKYKDNEWNSYWFDYGLFSEAINAFDSWNKVQS